MNEYEDNEIGCEDHIMETDPTDPRYYWSGGKKYGPRLDGVSPLSSQMQSFFNQFSEPSQLATYTFSYESAWWRAYRTMFPPKRWYEVKS